jgi:hypothetical protein
VQTVVFPPSVEVTLPTASPPKREDAVASLIQAQLFAADAADAWRMNEQMPKQTRSKLREIHLCRRTLLAILRASTGI